ncbi:MAG: hypothetical protein KA444_09455, partial [Bacteroidia bacterium]|nr:hypothetical protein [Bacteroidia bacterium]
MQGHFNTATEIVLGYGCYKKEKGILNKLIRFDAFNVAMNYFSSSLGGRSYMGVGRNLAYRRSLFFKGKGFAKHNHLFSGDDDLFVNENSTRVNTQIEIHPDSFTFSDPELTFSAWLKQKSRHMSTSAHYKMLDKFKLFLFPFSGFVFYASLITLLVLRFEWRILLSLYACVLVLKLPVLWRNTTRLREKDLFWTYPLLEPVHLLLQPIFYLSNLFTKQKAWK